MSYNLSVYDSPYFTQQDEEEEELTEEEKLRLQLEELGLTEDEELPSEEEEEKISEEEIAFTEVSTAPVEEDEEEDIELPNVYKSSYFQDSDTSHLKGKQLEYKGEAEGVSFYYDPDQNKHISMHTRGHEIDDGQFANFPSLLLDGKVVYDNSPDTEQELYNYWLKNDPSRIKYFKTEQEAEFAAKEKSKKHTEVGKRAGIIKGRKELTAGEAFELGARIERHTLGNIGRMITAGMKSMSDDMEYTEALKAQEKERTQVIFKELKEKYGKDFEGREGDAKVLAGRIVTAFTDPITFLLPWAKAAKLGKIAATGFGAGVGVTDMSIYEYAAYGEVNPTTLLFAGTIGGASGLAGKMIGDRMLAPKEKTVNLGVLDESGEEVIKISKTVDEPKITLTAREAEVLDDIGVTQIASQFDTILKGDLQVMPAINKLYENHKKVELTFRKAKRKYNDMLRGDKGPYYKNKKRAEKKIKDEYGYAYKTLEKKSKAAIDFTSETYPRLYMKATNGELEITDGAITEIAKAKELTEDLLTKILYEATRPIVGGGIGWSVGVFTDDDTDEDNAFTYALAGAGMFLGGMHSRIMRNPYIEAGMKAKAFGILENQQAIILHNALKFYTAGTTASISRALGGVNEAMSKLLFHNQFGGTRSITSAEQATDLSTVKLYEHINNKVTQGATEKQLTAAWWFTRNLEPEKATIKRLSLTPEDVIQAKKVSGNSKPATDFIGDTYVKEAGIAYKPIEDWGLPQIYNQIAIKSNPELFKTTLQKASKAQWGDKKIGTRIYNERMDDGSLWEVTKKGKLLFKGPPVLNHFHRKRQFTDPKAVKIIADAGFLETNIDTVLKKFISSSVQGIEFGRAMGMALRGFKKDGTPIVNYNVLNNFLKTLRQDLSTGKISHKDFKRKQNNIIRNVDLYFNRHGSAIWDSQIPKNAMAVLTFLGNSTMLTRSSIAQLGDLVQPLSNSHSFWSPIKAMTKMSLKGRNYAREFGLHHKSTYEKDVRALYAGADPDTKIQETVGTWNQWLFKWNAMTPLTDISARFAFNTGIEDAFKMAHKFAGQRVKKHIRIQLNNHGLTDSHLTYLKKFKTVDEAFDDSLGQRILIKSGNKMKDRDVGVPTAGNRQHFSQHKDPFIRSLGMFLSWAQFKTTQLNSLINRVENGDAALAIKMLAGVTVFGGIRELQIMASPARDYYEDNAPINWSPKWWQEATTLSGNVPWPVEKIARSFATNSGGTSIENITPLFSYLNKTAQMPSKVIRNFEAEDYEGAIVKAIEPLPLAKDLTNIINRIYALLGINEEYKDEPTRKRTKDYTGFFKGGKVSEDYPVPNAPVVPMERKDKLGNQSYATQASAAPINPFTGKPYTDIYNKG